MRDVFYINKKSGFYGNEGSGKTTSSGSSAAGKNRNLKDDALHRQTRDALDLLTEGGFFTESNFSSHFGDDKLFLEVPDYLNGLLEYEKKPRKRNLDDALISFGQTNEGGGGHQDKLFTVPRISENFLLGKSFVGGGSNSPFQNENLPREIGGENDGKEAGEGFEKDGEEEDMFVGLEETYGVVYCWGENLQGKQQQPCVMTVTPAGELFLILFKK